MRKSLRPFAALVIAVLVLGVAVPGSSRASGLSFAVDCKYGGEIKAIDAVDPTTVKFTLCYPDPALPAKAAFSAFDIHEAAQLKKTGGGGPDLLNSPIGTGPYMLQKWDHGNEIDLVANPNYRGTAPKVKTLVIKWNKEAAARWNELQAGTVDGIEYPAPGDFATIQANPDYKLYADQPTNIFYLGINNTVKPFDNIKVRQAIAHGIDKKRLVDNFYPPASTVADQFMPPSIFGFTPDSKKDAFDLNLAKQLMKESGVTLPIKTTLSYRDVVRGYLPQPGVIGQDIQAQLKQIGIEVTLNVVESGTFLAGAQAGKYDLVMLGWGADYPDATDFLDYHFNNPILKTFGNQDPKLTALLTKAAQLSDPAARLKLYKQANDEIADFVPMVPIANGGAARVFKATVKGAYGAAFAQTQFALLNPGSDKLVWEQSAEPISLYCNDETDGETLGICEQINEALLSYVPGGGDVKPGLAQSWSANKDLTEWTFKLVKGVKFSDGAPLTADDVVTSWTAEWDAASPMHKGNTGAFEYFSGFFNQFLNPPPPPTAAPTAAAPVAPTTAPAAAATKAATAAATVAPTMAATKAATAAATVAPTMAATK